MVLVLLVSARDARRHGAGFSERSPGAEGSREAPSPLLRWRPPVFSARTSCGRSGESLRGEAWPHAQQGDARWDGPVPLTASRRGASSWVGSGEAGRARASSAASERSAGDVLLPSPGPDGRAAGRERGSALRRRPGSPERRQRTRIRGLRRTRRLQTHDCRKRARRVPREKDRGRAASALGEEVKDERV